MIQPFPGVVSSRKQDKKDGKSSPGIDYWIGVSWLHAVDRVAKSLRSSVPGINGAAGVFAWISHNPFTGRQQS
jgi:hypothetical protein